MEHRTERHSMVVASLAIALALVFALSPAIGGGSFTSAAPSSPEGLNDGLPGVRYLHVATDENTSGNITYLNHALLNDNPNAIFFVTHTFNPGGGYSGVINEHHIGVFYSSGSGQWAIFN